MATKSTKSSKKVVKTNKDIPIDQKHQIISLSDFGNYNYDTRRKQWHQKAGHNDKQVVCAICKDNDNWATIQLNNGAHVCYFCWVKKPTEETKKMVANPKTISNNKKLVVKKTEKTNPVNFQDNNYNVVEIKKFYDNQGVSFRNKDDIQKYKTKKNTIDKTSKYGINPAVYYDSSIDYKKDFDELYVVKPYDHKYLLKASKNAKKDAVKLSKEVIAEYNNDVARAKLLTKKNMAIAKVDALRTLTKAIVLEKNYYELENEKLRHKQALQNIKLLREQRLEKNKIDLEMNIHNINAQNELELKKNEDNLIKTRVKIEERAAIIDLKIEKQKEKIRILSKGQDYKNISIKDQIRNIKNRNQIPNELGFVSDEDATVADLIRRIKTLDPQKMSGEEKGVIVKFLRLVDAYEKEQKYTELSNEYKDALQAMDKKISKTIKDNSKNKKANEYMIVSYDSYKKIVNAKKETLVITEPVQKMEQVVVRTKTVKVKKPSGMIDPVSNRQALVKIKPQQMHFEKIEPQRLNIDDLYYARDIQRTINKFRRIVGHASRAGDFSVSPYGSDAYKISYQKMYYTKYELKYKNDWRSIFKSKKRQANGAGLYDAEYVNLEEMDDNNWFTSLFKQKTNDYGEPLAKGLNKLRRMLEKLPSDPVVLDNQSFFKKERVDIANAISQLRKLEVTNNWTQKEVDQALLEVNSILDLYYEIVKKDTRCRKNVHKAQVCDERLTRKIDNYERSLANDYANADYRFNDKVRRINDRYHRNLENAENQSLLNIEYIYEQEQSSLAKEQQQHLWNETSMYEANNKLANNQYKYQNALISATVDEINRFNKNNDANPIVLSDMPSKIIDLPVTSDENICLSFDKIGSKIMVKSESNQRSNELVAKALNKQIPEDVKTVYVLDKYRNVKDVKTRVAMLNEYAKLSYEKAEKYNLQREAKELEAADAKLKANLKKVDKMYEDSTKIMMAAGRLNHLAEEREWVQKNFIKLKDEKWKVHDKDQKYREKIAKIQAREQELLLLKAEKEMNRHEKQRMKLASRKNQNVNYEDIIGKKNNQR